MKKLLILLFLPLLSFSQTSYYISSSSGNDNNTGTSSSSPWKTISKVNSIALSPGDKVLFKCGDTWNGTLTVNYSGTSDKPIVYGQYGKGANPLISGFSKLTGWVQSSGNLWSVVDNSLGSTLNIVTINGVNQAIGRYPKTGYKTYANRTENYAILDNSIGKSPSFVGGEVVIRKNHWVLDRGVVASQSGATITYTSATDANSYVPTPGNGYFFQNHINCLSQNGDWCYNAAQHKLTMYFGSGNPSSYTIKAAAYATVLIIPKAKSYVNFTSIDFEGANTYGLSAVANCSHMYIYNCNFNNMGQDGLHFTNGNYIRVRNCSITNCNNNGYYNTNGTYCSVVSSLVKNIHTIAGMGKSGDGNGMGIEFAGINPSYSYCDTVSSNTITNCGYDGIYINGNGYLVQNNYIDTFCTNKDDGGGIYTYVGYTTYAYSSRRQIINNVITNGVGATDGTPLPVASSGHGIYLDDNSSEVTVSGNRISNCSGAGINGNSNHNCSFTNNTVLNCGKAGQLFGQVRLMDSNRAPKQPYNLVFTGNNLISGNDNQLLISFQSQRAGATASGFSSWGKFDNDNFSGNSASSLFFHYVLTDKWPGQAETLTNWKKKINLEINSLFK